MNMRNRTSYLLLLALCVAASTLVSARPLVALAAPVAEGHQRPNIIVIVTDQQSATMMSCTGNRWLKTPAMDYLAKNGIRFERAYTTNPVCSPARIGFMTGRFPGSFRAKKTGPARENRGAMAVTEVPKIVQDTNLGAYLKRAGYELVYGGKTHLPRPLSPTQLGFRTLTKDQRDELASQCAAFVKQTHQQPYFLFVSLINPHDICYYAINDFRFDTLQHGLPRASGGIARDELLTAMRTPAGVDQDTFLETLCPPLPPNHQPQLDEPAAVKKLLKIRNFRWHARETYSDNDWRLHRWAYHRLTERVDGQIQIILDALRTSGQEDKTLVILTSDHGDHDSAHKMEHKSAPYEEAARIPLVVMYKGTAPPGRVDNAHLVSNGLDLLPTVCDYAGLPSAKGDPRGRSLRALIEAKPIDQWRPTLGVESEIGRMVVGYGVKYIRYDFAGDEEQLLDLRSDPGETRNFSDDPAHATILQRMRTAFDHDWFPGISGGNRSQNTP